MPLGRVGRLEDLDGPLLLLASELEGGADGRETALAAVAELVHLASVVHDDSVDHSNVRRGQPTINALFSHQIAVIMGDYLYSKALAELVRLGRRGGGGARAQVPRIVPSGATPPDGAQEIGRASCRERV